MREVREAGSGGERWGASKGTPSKRKWEATGKMRREEMKGNSGYLKKDEED